MPPAAPALMSPSQLADLVRAVAAEPASWQGRIRYDRGHRWYLQLARDEAHEIWLLSWLPGQRTGFHDHAASAGAFTVVRGSLCESTAPDGRPRHPGRQVTQGAVRAFGPGYVHDVMNTSRRHAVSIHAYSPRLTSMRRFEPGPGGLLQLTGEDRSW